MSHGASVRQDTTAAAIPVFLLADSIDQATDQNRILNKESLLSLQISSLIIIQNSLLDGMRKEVLE